MNWFNAGNETDSAGKLTPLANALRAIEAEGCDCEADEGESHTCIAGVCEAALKAEWERAEAAETMLTETRKRFRVIGTKFAELKELWAERVV